MTGTRHSIILIESTICIESTFLIESTMKRRLDANHRVKTLNPKLGLRVSFGGVLFLNSAMSKKKETKVPKGPKAPGFSHPGLTNYINLKQCYWVPMVANKNTATTLKFWEEELAEWVNPKDFAEEKKALIPPVTKYVFYLSYHTHSLYIFSTKCHLKCQTCQKKFQVQKC